MNKNRSMQEEPQEQQEQQEQQRSARVVVAAVIERDGLILAARRTEPPELAGGNAEQGESDGEALERECREELGVRIVVGERIGPEYRVPSGAMVVRTYLATIEDGEPRPLESHDELAWVRPGTPEMRSLPWLDGDFLILDALDVRRAAAADQPPGVIRVA
jgi:8-oxo-dGTP diphosphatase